MHNTYILYAVHEQDMNSMENDRCSKTVKLK